MTTQRLSNREDQLRAYLLEVSEVCPIDTCGLEECPISAVRKLDLKQRSRWFEELDEKDLAFLAAYHYICLDLKVEAKLADLDQPKPIAPKSPVTMQLSRPLLASAIASRHEPGPQ